MKSAGLPDEFAGNRIVDENVTRDLDQFPTEEVELLSPILFTSVLTKLNLVSSRP